MDPDVVATRLMADLAQITSAIRLDAYLPAEGETDNCFSVGTKGIFARVDITRDEKELLHQPAFLVDISYTLGSAIPEEIRDMVAGSAVVTVHGTLNSTTVPLMPYKNGFYCQIPVSARIGTAHHNVRLYTGIAID